MMVAFDVNDLRVCDGIYILDSPARVGKYETDYFSEECLPVSGFQHMEKGL